MQETVFNYEGRTIEIVLGVQDADTPDYYYGSRAKIDGSFANLNPINGTIYAVIANVIELIDRTSR